MTYGKTYRMLEADKLLDRQHELLLWSTELNRHTGDRDRPE
jgi:hypothetical protein